MVALALAAVYGVGTWLTIHYCAADASDWPASKWNGVWGGVMAFAANSVMNDTLAESFAVGVALGLLVLGASWLGYVVALAQFSTVAAADVDSEAARDGEAA